MIERLIGIVLDGKAKVSEILAVTFTEAAAAEMKQKLVSALRKRLIDGGDNSAVRAALDEVPSASISTIHKFCADLLRSYFYEIGLDPAFKIADETAACEIQNAAADKTFSELYDAGDEDFLYLVRIFRSGRSDAELKKVIKRRRNLLYPRKTPRNFSKNAAPRPRKRSLKKSKTNSPQCLKKEPPRCCRPLKTRGKFCAPPALKSRTNISTRLRQGSKKSSPRPILSVYPRFVRRA